VAETKQHKVQVFFVQPKYTEIVHQPAHNNQTSLK